MAIIDANRGSGVDISAVSTGAGARRVATPAISRRDVRRPHHVLRSGAGGRRSDLVIGFNGVLLGELIGIDADVGYAPGFFQSGGQHLFTRSSATTLTGNVVIALPRRLTEFTLRPYFVGGAGVVQASINDPSKVLSVSSTLPAVDLGGGVTGFLSDRIGVSWDVRHFRSFGGKARNLSFGREQLSFWRANMALVFRY